MNHKLLLIFAALLGGFLLAPDRSCGVPNPTNLAHVCANKRWPGAAPMTVCFVPPELEI
jgi:hypothetical protein